MNIIDSAYAQKVNSPSAMQDCCMQGFVAYPPALLATLTPEQLQWQQEIYRRAFEQAQTPANSQRLVVSLPRVSRN